MNSLDFKLSFQHEKCTLMHAVKLDSNQWKIISSKLKHVRHHEEHVDIILEEILFDLYQHTIKFKFSTVLYIYHSRN